MAKTRNRIKKMNFQIQERKVEELTPLSEDDKYIIEMAMYMLVILTWEPLQTIRILKLLIFARE